MFEQAFRAVGYGVLITDTRVEAPGPTIRFVNAAMCDLTGYSEGELVGTTPRILQGPDTDRAMLDQLKEALRLGRTFKGEALNYRKDGSRYFVDWTIDPVLNSAGVIEAWISVQRDVTRRRKTRQALQESEQTLQVLVAELQHRTRNLMGVVSSMADKTVSASADLPDFQSRFRDRLEALSRVQGLLSRLNDHDRVTFDELIRTELAALDGSADGVTLSGPADVRIRSSTVQALAMALHELATNAVKYGALRQPSGKLAITWSFQAEGAGGKPWLFIDWRESGVVMPDRTSAQIGSGQGRELIERALPYQLKARTSFTFEPDGVHCTIAIPVSSSSGAG
ncbi:HWE histidine kinase domain-containing protein [uncultured Sphingomonas sp.]|uniref:HWE histidine kinase domain-containing protein n=1 Tax=uncultured Sphingomonas sp. TaxID=158754 RepID=UPI0025D369ED|nr:HWE histidine kinase domain-containing protein [uncultured Sphingomonas sp.]